MSRATIIDGKAIAEALRREVAAGVAALKRERGVTPGLAVVLVGEDPASQVYVRTKGKAGEQTGMLSFEHKLPADTPEAALLALIGELNRTPGRARHPGAAAAAQAHRRREGHRGDRSGQGRRRLSPRQHRAPGVGRQGAGAVHANGLPDPGQVGRAQARGAGGRRHRPLQHRRQAGGADAAGESCTVTIAHSRTRDLPAVVRRADLVVAAVGRPEMVRGSWIKPGAIVIDVGIQRITGPDGKSRLVGDVAFAEAADVARAITPVPGGVGPMTVACLLRNTLQAAKMQVSDPPGLTPLHRAHG